MNIVRQLESINIFQSLQYISQKKLLITMAELNSNIYLSFFLTYMITIEYKEEIMKCTEQIDKIFFILEV